LQTAVPVQPSPQTPPDFFEAPCPRVIIPKLQPSYLATWLQHNQELARNPTDKLYASDFHPSASSLSAPRSLVCRRHLWVEFVLCYGCRQSVPFPSQGPATQKLGTQWFFPSNRHSEPRGFPSKAGPRRKQSLHPSVSHRIWHCSPRA